MNLHKALIANEIFGDGGSGGGGSSDFSTAEVTVVNNSSKTYNFYGVFIDNNALCLGFNIDAMSLSGATEKEVQLVLYSSESPEVGVSDTGGDPPSNVVTTGNASYEDGYITITGNCTITITNA